MRSSLLFIAVLACLLLVLAPLSASAGRLRRSAQQAKAVAAEQPHILNNVTVSSGNWTGTLSVLYEYLAFSAPDGSTITSFPVTPTTPYTFGLLLDPSDDFDAIYQITLIETAPTKALTEKRVCLFVISGYSPGHPQVLSVPFSGSVKCSWENNGFTQSFYAL